MKSLHFLAAFTLILCAILSSALQSPMPTRPPARIKVSESVMDGMILSRTYPNYPEDARRMHATGNATVAIVIDRDGNVVRAALVRGNIVLADAAEAAVKQWKYKPFQVSGNPVEVETTATVVFRDRMGF
jgi:protein TonB